MGSRQEWEQMKLHVVLVSCLLLQASVAQQTNNTSVTVQQTESSVALCLAEQAKLVGTLTER